MSEESKIDVGIYPQNAQFREHGFITEPGFLDANQVQEVRQVVQGLVDEKESKDGIWKYFKDEKLIRIEYFIDKLPVWFRTKCLKFTEDMVGQPVAIFKEKINLKPPGTGLFEPHQDAQAGWDQYGHTIHYNLGVALDPCSFDNGYLYVSPGNHDRGLIGPKFGNIPPEIVNTLDWVSLPCHPGDAILFDSFIPHKSSVNQTQSDRWLLLLTYSLVKEGDGREAYHADKLNHHPPRARRLPDQTYRGYVI